MPQLLAGPQSAMQALLALAWLWPVLGDDGCLDDCEWKCGDVCLSGGGACQCGEKIFGWDDGLWCCHTGSCTTQGESYDGTASCPGTALNLTKACRSLWSKHGYNLPCLAQISYQLESSLLIMYLKSVLEGFHSAQP